jgi:glycosyltransferase involved in cell wall biosynthesis
LSGRSRPLKILHIAPTFHPATFYGGPIFSAHALCNAMAADPRIELRVLATDAAGPKRSQRLEVRAFPSLYPAGYPVFFTRRLLGQSVAPGLLLRLWSMIGWADVVHLTATYSFPSIPTLALARLRGRPVLWSLRGALLASHTWDGARRLWAKRVWERLCRVVASDRVLLHTTSEDERAASLARLPGMRAVVIPHGIDIPAAPSRQWQPGGVLRLMFLGRLDPVKGIENLIEASALLGRGATRLDIYGSGSPDYVARLKHLAASKLGEMVRFHGHAEGEHKRKAFAEADICVLPSFTENFGMVVAEALAHGVPVIVSRGAPWSEVEQRGCGRWVDNSPTSLAAAITALRRENLEEMGNAGRRWMQAEFDWHAIAERTLAAMLSLLEGTSSATPTAKPS